MTAYGFLNALDEFEIVEFYAKYRDMISDSDRWWQDHVAYDSRAIYGTKEWYIVSLESVLLNFGFASNVNDELRVETMKRYMNDFNVIDESMNSLPNRPEFVVDRHIESVGNKYIVFGTGCDEYDGHVYSNYNSASAVVMYALTKE